MRHALDEIAFHPARLFGALLGRAELLPHSHKVPVLSLNHLLGGFQATVETHQTRKSQSAQQQHTAQQRNDQVGIAQLPLPQNRFIRTFLAAGCRPEAVRRGIHVFRPGIRHRGAYEKGGDKEEEQAEADGTEHRGNLFIFTNLSTNPR